MAPASPAVGAPGPAEWLQRYESLRRQALTAGHQADTTNPDVAFIEQQGLAAWLSRAAAQTGSGPDGQAVAALRGQLPEITARRDDLVLVLAELVLGDHKELHDER
jgi:hypothetical protein